MSDNVAENSVDAPDESTAPPTAAEVLKKELANYTAQAKEFLVIDLKAIPADKHTVSPGGEARAPLKMIAECAQLNRIVADYIGGRAMRHVPREEAAAYYASFDTADRALAFLDEATAELVADIGALDVPTKAFGGRPPLWQQLFQQQAMRLPSLI